MKKILVFISSVLVAGCFICHKTDSQEEVVAQQPQPPAAVIPAEPIVTHHFISEVANFKFDSSEALPNEDKMNELKQKIAADPQAMILVEGHTDNIGTVAYNQKLSEKRAQAVVAQLVKQGYPNEIRSKGLGSTSPIASNDTEEGRAQNRRVDVTLVRE